MSASHQDSERLAAAIEMRKRLRQETLHVLRAARLSVGREAHAVREAIRDDPDWRHVRPEENEVD